MKLRRLAWRGLVFHWRRHVAVGLGVCVSSAVLTGALVVGDSVGERLRRIAELRVGRTELSVQTGDFEVAPDLGSRLGSALGAHAAPVLRIAGTATGGDGRLRVGRVQVLGVDPAFWALAASPVPFRLGPGEAVVNRRLAALLALGPGDELVLRVEEERGLPLELPIAWQPRSSRPTRLLVAAVADDDRLGRFDLASHQASPATVFVAREHLATVRGARDRANLILLARGARTSDADLVWAALRRTLALDDLGLTLAPTRTGGQQLVSDRFFLPTEVARVALAVHPEASGVLAYFANALRSRHGSTPYSFVAAAGPPWVDAGTSDDEIVLGDWLARDLQVQSGDAVGLSYFVPDAGTRLVERSERLRVRAIVSGPGTADPELVPPLEGLTDAEACRGWNPALPLDLRRIRDVDEEYWKAHRAAPKAFVTLRAAQRLFKNRHGTLTSVRYPSPAGDERRLAREIAGGIELRALGWQVRPLRADGLRAAAGGMDFGLLLLGLSVFLIAGALVFVALFQVLSVVRRTEEWWTLSAVGLSRAQVQAIVLLEGLPVALLASIMGAGLAGLCAVLVLASLPGLFEPAAPGLAVSLRPRTLALGLSANAAISALVMVAASRRIGTIAPAKAAATSRGLGRVHSRTKAVSAAAALAAAAAFATAAPSSQRVSVVLAWCCGLLALAAGVLGSAALVERLGSRPLRSVAGLGLANLARAGRRSATLVGVLGAAVFVVSFVALGGGKPVARGSLRQSGTGGFAFVGETARPIRHDLEQQAARRALGLPGSLAARFVSLRVREGDDAGCRNLNQVVVPRIVGVDPAALAARGAFWFVETLPGLAADATWSVLDRELGDDTVPAVADASVIAWGLRRKLGDVIELSDDAGRPVRLRLVAALDGSILQGSVLIAERSFERLFPTVVGYQGLLVDAESGTAGDVAAALRESLRDHGLELVPARQRLSELRAVEDAYLAVFLALGGLGLVFGTAGCASIVARDVIERAGELATLRAMGFGLAEIERLLVTEHATLFVLGVLCGAFGASLASLPGAPQHGASAYGTVAFVCAAVVATGATASRLACRRALQRTVVAGLRCE